MALGEKGFVHRVQVSTGRGIHDIRAGRLTHIFSAVENDSEEHLPYSIFAFGYRAELIVGQRAAQAYYTVYGAAQTAYRPVTGGGIFNILFSLLVASGQSDQLTIWLPPTVWRYVRCKISGMC